MGSSYLLSGRDGALARERFQSGAVPTIFDYSPSLPMQVLGKRPAPVEQLRFRRRSQVVYKNKRTFRRRYTSKD